MCAAQGPIQSQPKLPLLVSIPAGWFSMGSDAGQDNERPIRRVWVDEFLLAACQVTNADYACFLQATGNPPPPLWSDPLFNRSDQPVAAISWFEASRYCEWLAAATGRPFRLSTEAEW
jgi:formylglycine-generating enzyme required for sulfatase activity